MLPKARSGLVCRRAPCVQWRTCRPGAVFPEPVKRAIGSRPAQSSSQLEQQGQRAVVDDSTRMLAPNRPVSTRAPRLASSARRPRPVARRPARGRGRPPRPAALRVSPYNVNWLTTSTAAPVVGRAALARAGSAARHLAGQRRGLLAVSAWVTPTSTSRPAPIAAHTSPSTVTEASVTRCTTALIAAHPPLDRRDSRKPRSTRSRTTGSSARRAPRRPVGASAAASSSSTSRRAAPPVQAATSAATASSTSSSQRSPCAAAAAPRRLPAVGGRARRWSAHQVGAAAAGRAQQRRRRRCAASQRGRSNHAGDRRPDRLLARLRDVLGTTDRVAPRPVRRT